MTKSTKMTPIDPNDLQYGIRSIQADYKSAMREARHCVDWLKGQIADAERGLDEAFTPGNMGSTVAKLEAARWKAKALKEALEMIGQTPEGEQ